MFKYAAILALAAESFIALKVIFILGLVLGIYGIAALLWVWALQFIPLNRAYPLMGLSFMIVPVGSWFFFGEKLNLAYGVGVLMIAGGIIVISQSMSS